MTPSAATPTLDAAALAYAIARNDCGEKLPLKDVLDALGIALTTPGLKSLLRSDGFKTRLAGYVRELKESGESFKLKARVQAEELLRTQWEIITSKDTPASVRMDGIKSLVEWADLKPRKDTGQVQPPAISIHIDLGNDRTEVIDVTPAAPELESP